MSGRRGLLTLVSSHFIISASQCNLFPYTERGLAKTLDTRLAKLSVAAASGRQRAVGTPPPQRGAQPAALPQDTPTFSIDPENLTSPGGAVREPPLRHARRGSRGPLWQHQYWDRFVRDEKEFNERLDYMHLNPVKKGLVKRR